MRDRDDMRGHRSGNGDAGPDPLEPKRRYLNSPKFWVGAGLAIYLLIFMLLNREQVQVNYLFFSHESRLIWVMIICVVFGFLVGWLWGRPSRVDAKRRAKKKDD